MNAYLVKLCVCLALSCSGCGTISGHRTVYSKPTFLEAEIRSTTWTDSRGNTIRLLDWLVIVLKNNGKLVIAKYGYADTGTVISLDFYQVVPKLTPDGPDAFVLIEHDQKYGAVANIETIWSDHSDDSVGLRITRDTIPASQKERVRTIYTLWYTEDYGMTQPYSIWTSNLADSAVDSK